MNIPCDVAERLGLSHDGTEAESSSATDSDLAYLNDLPQLRFLNQPFEGAVRKVIFYVTMIYAIMADLACGKVSRVAFSSTEGVVHVQTRKNDRDFCR